MFTHLVFGMGTRDASSWIHTHTHTHTHTHKYMAKLKYSLLGFPFKIQPYGCLTENILPSHKKKSHMTEF